VGVLSNLITTPVTLLIIYLFRKARLRTKRPSRITTALKTTNPEVAAKAENVIADANEQDKKKNKKKKGIPWWWRIVAWLLCVVLIAVSTVFVLFYGIQFGDEKARKWLSSILLSFVTGMLFTQPLKVLYYCQNFSNGLPEIDQTPLN
jgi:polycystin 1L2